MLEATKTSTMVPTRSQKGLPEGVGAGGGPRGQGKWCPERRDWLVPRTLVHLLPPSVGASCAKYVRLMCQNGGKVVPKASGQRGMTQLGSQHKRDVS